MAIALIIILMLIFVGSIIKVSRKPIETHNLECGCVVVGEVVIKSCPIEKQLYLETLTIVDPWYDQQFKWLENKKLEYKHHITPKTNHK